MNVNGDNLLSTGVSQMEGSIHPRNWPSNAPGKLKNTCKPRNNKRKGKLGKASARLALRRLSHSATIKSVSDPMAFRSPGSMNQNKR